MVLLLSMQENHLALRKVQRSQYGIIYNSIVLNLGENVLDSI